ncbi:MAG: L-ribulose-5-phosphate 4-epimerase [Eubacteriales bacterium]
MLEELKKQVYEACMAIPRHRLAIFTWGNVSGIDREKGLVVIKPSGVEYDDLTPDLLPVVDLMSGKVIEGELNPSSDTPTHLELYRRFPEIGGVTHTHSQWATTFAQAGHPVHDYGTTHADYFDGPVPCTRPMTAEEINGEYELETGRVIAECFEKYGIDPMRVPAVLVHSHGPFTWGKTPMNSVEYAVILEYVAEMAFHTEILASPSAQAPRMQSVLLRKHFDRKHGPNAYYGQKKK